MTSQHTTSPSGNSAPAGSRPAELVHTSSNANFFKLVTLQLRGWYLWFLPFWPGLVAVQYWAQSVQHPDDFSIPMLFIIGVGLGQSTFLAGWNAYRLRALSLATVEIRKILLGVRLVVIVLIQVVLWLCVCVWFPLPSLNGALLVSVVTLLNVAGVIVALRATEDNKSEVSQEETTKAGLDKDVDEISKAGSLETSMLGNEIDFGAKWAGLLALAVIVVAAMAQFVLSDSKAKAAGIFMLVILATVVGFLGAALESLLTRWITISGSRRIWFDYVSRRTGAKLWWGVPLISLCLIAIYIGKNPGQEASFVVLGSQVAGAILLVATFAIVAVAIVWATLMISIGLSAQLRGWWGLVVLVATYSALTTLLGALGIWTLWSLGFGGGAQAPIHGSMQLAVHLTIAAMAIFVGGGLSRSLVLKSEVNEVGLSSFLGLNQEFQK